MIDFSIITANFNKGEYIAQAIESVFKQTYSAWELIIIDDASSDDSVKIIKSHIKNDRVRLFINEKNLGYIETLKRLINIAQAPIIGILDPDDALAKTAVEEAMRVYCKHPKVGFVYTQNYRCDENLKPFETGYSGIISSGKTNLHLNTVHCFRTFKKDLYLETSGYDNQMLFGEDIDLVLKLEEKTKPYFIDKPLYYYRILKKSQTHSFRNEMINRSSTALAKYNAYKRRLNTEIPNLTKIELSEVLFFGIFTSLFSFRFELFIKFIINIIKINPFFFLNPMFYKLIFIKIIKILKLKTRNAK